MKVPAWIAGVLVIAAGCSESKPSPEGGPVTEAEPSATAASSASAPASASASASAAAPSGCRLGERKVLATGVNARTGLTPQRFADGSSSVGVAVGNRPHRVKVDAAGAVTLERVDFPTGHPLARGIPRGEGVRHLQRVTPSKGAAVYADFRDKYEDGRRRISCGPLDGKTFLYFLGEPLLDVDTSGRKTKPGEEVKKAKTISATPTMPPVDPSASASAPPPPPPPPPTEKSLRELRDCRTVVDPQGADPFAIGSELVGSESDGTTRWRMQFFVTAKGSEGPRTILHSEPLGEEPEKLHTLEAPVAYRLSSGGWALAGRYRGRMYGWTLDADKRVQGRMRSYGGGYPGLPRLAEAGDGSMLLLSQAVAPKTWKLKGLRLPAMPATMFDPVLTDAASASEPSLAVVGDQRWLSFHVGQRRVGGVHVAPVDEQLRQTGPATPVTEEGEQAYESVLISAGEGLVLLSILRPEGEGTQLVSRTLTCTP